VIALLLFGVLGWNDILELRAEEPRRAIVAMEMLLSGDFVVPHINGWSYYNKPPVFNWCLILFFKIFGSFEEWVVRLPSILAYLMLAVVNYFFVRKFTSKEIAIFSSLFFLTTVDLLFYGTINAGEIDLFYSLLVFLQLIAIFYFFEKEHFLGMFLASYFFAALGTLTKGTPSIAFQALTLLSWLVLNRRWRLLFHWKHFCGIVLFVLIVGGYFYTYSKFDDALGFMARLFKEASQRTGMEHDFSKTLIQSLLFPFNLFKSLLPWSLLSIFFYRKDFVKLIKQNRLLYFVAILILFNIPIYWFNSDFRARYLYMFFPFFSLLFAYFFFQAQSLSRWQKGIEKLFLVIMILATLAFLSPPFIPQTKDLPLIFLKCIFLAGIALGIILLYKRHPIFKLLLFVGFLALLRIALNLTLLPATENFSDIVIYNKHVDKVLSITNNQSIHWAGKPQTFEPDASIGPITMKKIKLTSAPLLPYQIPYYITKGNGHVMQFDPVLRSDQYYLAHKSFVDERKLEILYRFPDMWLNDEIVLFKN
jgi:4-amino-4-deoxy-L-arabinose transferase-like glycosyltransferase